MTQELAPSFQDYLDRNVKEIIGTFPPVEELLDRHGIGCASCGLGTCQLKDIVEIHDLAPDDEAALLTAIAAAIFPGRDVTIPHIERQPKSEAASGSYSPPLAKLVEEHRLIKRWVAVIPAFIERLEVETGAGREAVRRGIDFIRSFADRYHHAKEEDLLFKCFDENLDIIKAMYADHERARGLVRDMLEALERHDRTTLADDLAAYRDLLTEHVRKEDEVLYRWMDRNLSMKQVGELFSQFAAIDEQSGDAPAYYGNFITNLENSLTIKEEEHEH
jgi:hemerythrin-like domain-containing protein